MILRGTQPFQGTSKHCVSWLQWTSCHLMQWDVWGGKQTIFHFAALSNKS